ncbi:MAG: WHG domain-containing protein [Clostridia bacterium]|nr:WHG domain-containing protein [Clostridia bacterium]
MPAKKQITKQLILEKAVDIVRQSGVSALNMRTLASACNCSTQPIYLSFSGTEELKSEVARAVLEVFNRSIEYEIKSGKYPEYKAVGMGYIRFAKEEKQLFKFLLMDDGMELSGMGKDSFNKSAGIIDKNYRIGTSAAEKLHLQMWIFVHGIASMFATDFIDWDVDTVSNLVTDAYAGFMKNIKGEN